MLAEILCIPILNIFASFTYEYQLVWREWEGLGAVVKWMQCSDEGLCDREEVFVA